MGNLELDLSGLKNKMQGGAKESAAKPKYGQKKNNQKWDKPRRNDMVGYVGAPYNFVPFHDKAYQYPDDKLTKHNQMEDDLITGELAYEIKAETPVMIDDGNGSFFRDEQGRYAIPGSTMRGLIRNNVQILGLCGYEDDIDDYELMYRNVANGAEKEHYNQTLGAKQLRINDGNKSYGIGVLLNVHAGYVVNEGGTYVIYQTTVDSIKKEFQGMNYYVLSERKIVNEYLKFGKRSSFSFFCRNGKSILQHEFERFDSYEDRNKRTHYKGVPNKRYVPYYEPVSYDVANEKDIIAVGDPGKYKNAGYAVSTGKMQEKKAVYIIPEIDRKKDSITIPEKDVRAFRIDLKKKENTLKQFGGRDYFDLPKEGEQRPIFYIQLHGRLYFGFTPRLRLFYEHTIKEGLKQNVKEGKIDYAKALFGYSAQNRSYKSKISFSNALLCNDAGMEKEEKRILAEPKPTSYLDYLEQNGKGNITYNTDGFKLRGAKQYWLHGKVAPVDPINNEKAASAIQPLSAGAIFRGKIRFQNLTEDELGLLLWAVRLNEGSQMNVGKAKAYGYGRISVTIVDAKKFDMKKAYDTGGILDMDPFCEIDVDNAIQCYKNEIQTYLGRPIEALRGIREFFMMKDSEHIPGNDKTRYMSIAREKKEYQNRVKNKAPLPGISDVVKP